MIMKNLFLISLVHFIFLSAAHDVGSDNTLTCQVKATAGVTESLTATYYLTAPADLHYAVVTQGHTIDDPLQIKNAKDFKATSCKASGKITADKAQRLSFDVDSLVPDTLYDVFFVAEVTGSNGVFGKIVSVKGVKTHKPAPKIKDPKIKALDASATALELSLSMDGAGEVYYMVKTIGNSTVPLSTEFLITQQRADIVALGQMSILNTSVHRFTVDGLNPETDYAVFIVSETTASEGVLGDVVAFPNKRTHTRPPSFTGTVTAKDASSDEALLKLTLESPGDIHYVVTSTDITLNASSEIKSQQLGAKVFAKVSHLNKTGEIIESIKGLKAGTTYHVFYATESHQSNGLFSDLYSDQVTTHASPPGVSDISATPSNGSSQSIEFNCTLESSANLHYLLCAQHTHIHQISQFLSTECIRRGNVSLKESDSLSIHQDIVDLEPSTRYTLYLVSETTASNGLYGKLSPGIQVTTHEVPPEIVALNAVPKNGNQTALVITAQVTKPGIVHFTINATASPLETVHQGMLECRQANTNCTIDIGNLFAGTPYQLAAFTEPLIRNRVLGLIQPLVYVKTHDDPPDIVTSSIQPANASTNTLLIHCSLSTKGLVHYVVAKNGSKVDENILVHGKEVPGVSILRQGGLSNQSSIDGILQHTAFFNVSSLQANSWYDVYLFTETEGSNGVFNQRLLQAPPTLMKTHAEAPKFDKYFAVPSNASTTGITIIVNLTTPALVHYAIPDFKADDPTILRTASRGKLAVKKGSFLIDENSLNQSIYHQVKDMQNGTIHHVHLVTETIGSNGVFSVPTAPIVVTTHEEAPKVSYIEVFPTYGMNHSVTIKFRLDRHGDLHYAVYFKRNATEKSVLVGDATDTFINNSEPEVPIPSLTPQMIKDAEKDEKIRGNGTVVVKREESYKGEITTEVIKDLYPGAYYELCYATETSNSNGVFHSDVACVPVQTHIEYGNRSEEVYSAFPVGGTTDTIELTYFLPRILSKGPLNANTPGVESATPKGGVQYVADQCGRVIHYLVTSGHLHAKEGKNIKNVVPGENSVAASGILSHVYDANDSTLILKQNISHLQPRTKYTVYFVTETYNDSGVFSPINQGVGVETFANAPRITSYRARPTQAKSDNITVHLSIESSALVHIFVLQKDCEKPRQEGYEYVTIEGCLKAKREYNSSNQRDFDVFIGGLDDNTDYDVYLVSETFNSTGVFGEMTPKIGVKTYQKGPLFTMLMAEPKKGCTNELKLHYQLATKGDIHYIVGPSGELNVSNATDLINHRHSHLFWRRTIRDVDSSFAFVEPLPYLKPGIVYDVYVVSETTESKGVYGDVQVLRNISTYKIAPHILSQGAFPSPGSAYDISITFSLDTPGELHYLVTIPGVSTAATIKTGDIGGTIVMQKTLSIGAAGEAKEEMIPVPFPDTVYNILLVTETSNSYGVYGDVATQVTVKSFALAPKVLSIDVFPTDARTDGISIKFQLNHSGNLIYYVMKRHYKPLHDVTERLKDVNLISHGIANASTKDFTTTENVSSLTQGTTYDVYYMTETYGSQGIVSDITIDPITVRTHGPPPKVLEDIDCSMAPNCTMLGREECWIESNTCGECKAGYHGERGASNTTCYHGIPDRERHQENLNNIVDVSLDDTASYLTDEATRNIKSELGEKLQQEDENAELGTHKIDHLQDIDGKLVDSTSTSLETQEPIDLMALHKSEQHTAPKEEIQSSDVHSISFGQTNPSQQSWNVEDHSSINRAAEEAMKAYAAYSENTAENLTAGIEIQEPASTPTSCPMNSVQTGPGQCQCNAGYTINAQGTACVSTCPANSSPVGPGECRCNAGFTINQEQTACVPLL